MDILSARLSFFPPVFITHGITQQFSRFAACGQQRLGRCRSSLVDPTVSVVWQGLAVNDLLFKLHQRDTSGPQKEDFNSQLCSLCKLAQQAGNYVAEKRFLCNIRNLSNQMFSSKRRKRKLNAIELVLWDIQELDSDFL